MPFQSTVNNVLGFGVVGELAFEGPLRAQSLILTSGSAANNVVGRAFTMVSEGVAQAGGSGQFAGILSNPKTYASRGTTADGSLAPTLTLANYEQGEFVTMGILNVAFAGAFNIGDGVLYDTTTGALSAGSRTASGTGSIATTTLTVSAVDAGSALFAVGQRVTGPNIAPDTYISAILTGTGGVGTYTVTVSQTAASGAVSADASATPPSGKAFIPNAKVSHYTGAGAGLGVITLTN